MNLSELTNHESGIICYPNGDIAVYNWGDCGENEMPILSPFGGKIVMPEADGVFDDVKSTRIEDIRKEFDDDQQVIYDVNDDIMSLLNDPLPPDELTGTAYTLKDGRIIYTLDSWV